ncbi:F0F1 ATP synthase subunit delta [Aerococcaceae bacterium WGS1372]
MKIDKNNTSLSEEQLLYHLASSSAQDRSKILESFRLSESTGENLKITSAQQLTEEEKADILNAIQNVMPVDTNNVKYFVDPDLIAGIRVQSRSYFYDNTIKRQLNDIDGYLHSNINLN